MTGFPEFPGNGHAFSAEETGQALAGLIRRNGAGMPVPGFLGRGPLVTAVASSWKVQITPCTYVRVSGAAVWLSGLAAAKQVDIVPAAGDVSAGQSRIDLIGWDTANSLPVVLKGAPATSPVAPPLGGLKRIAAVRVNAGDGQVIQAQIERAFEKTALQGSGGVQGRVAPRSIVAGGVTAVPIVFPPDSFASAPVVLATGVGDARDVTVHVDNITKDGFTLRLGAVGQSRSLGAVWRAFGDD